MTPGEPLALRLLVMQGTQFCNIDCRYCYLPNRSKKGVMSEAVLDAVIARLAEHPLVDKQVTVLWHVGEPLTAGLAFYRRAFEATRALDNARYSHAIQTNGMLVTDEFCDLFNEHSVHIGVSLDGPRHIHDANRRTRSGVGTFDATMAAIDRLRAHNVPTSIISVITAQSIDRLGELFAFYDKHNLRRVAFNIEEIEGANKTTSTAAFGDAAISALWRRVFELSVQHGISVREIDHLVPRLLGQKTVNSQTAPGHHITIAHNGDFSTYSPELIAQSCPAHGSFVIGNVLTTSFLEAFASPRNQAILADIAQGVANCRAACPYFTVCQGGQPSNKVSEAGSLAATETTHCRQHLKLRADAFLDALERNADTIARRAAARQAEKAAALHTMKNPAAEGSGARWTHIA